MSVAKYVSVGIIGSDKETLFNCLGTHMKKMSPVITRCPPDSKSKILCLNMSTFCNSLSVLNSGIRNTMSTTIASN